MAVLGFIEGAKEGFHFTQAILGDVFRGAKESELAI